MKSILNISNILNKFKFSNKEMVLYYFYNYVFLLAIMVFLWNIDYSANNVIGIPFIFHTYYISGIQLYVISVIPVYIISILLLLLNQYYHILLALFDFVILIDFALFVLYKVHDINLQIYGIYWNDLIFFAGFPLLISFLTLNSYKKLEKLIYH